MCLTNSPRGKETEMTDTYNVTVEMSRDERDYILQLLLKIATAGDTNPSERLEILDVMSTLMTEEK